MSKKLYQDEAWLKKKYWEEKLSTRRMAKLAGCSCWTIGRYLKYYGIPRRDNSEALKAALDPTISEGKARRRKMSENSKVAWARGAYDGETYRQKKSEAAKAAWARGAFGGEAHRQKLSEATKAAWARSAIGGEAHRQKLSEALKAAYDPTTSEGKVLRRKMSEAHRAACDPSTPKGRAIRQKLSEAGKAARDPATPEGRALRQKHSVAMKAVWARGVMDGVFQSPTSIEIAVSDALDELGIGHEPQYRPDGYSRVYDEFVPPNVLIEVQGDYWHSSDEAQERDAEKATWAHANGYHLVVIWEHEIHEVGALEIVKERVGYVRGLSDGQ